MTGSGVFIILKVAGESDFYTDYNGRVLIRHIISLCFDVYTYLAFSKKYS